jgi:hypothetical protein
VKHCCTLVLFALAGCAAAPVEPPAPTTSFAPLSLDGFPGAAKVLSGFDDRVPGSAWCDRDQALFAMQLDKGGETVRWLLHLEAPLGARVAGRNAETGAVVPLGLSVTRTIDGTGADGTPRSWKVTTRRADVTVRVLDAAGELLARSEITLPVDTLEHGLLPAIDHMLASKRGEAIDENGERAFLEAMLAIIALLDVLRDDEALSDYFWQVIEKPSLWSVVTSFGITTNTTASFDKSIATTVPSPLPATGRAFSAPLRIDVNGSPALFVDLLACDASRPYAICGGIVAAVARHPTRSDVTLRMQLVAARSGSEATRL